MHWFNTDRLVDNDADSRTQYQQRWVQSNQEMIKTHGDEMNPVPQVASKQWVWKKEKKKRKKKAFSVQTQIRFKCVSYMILKPVHLQ